MVKKRHRETIEKRLSLEEFNAKLAATDARAP